LPADVGLEPGREIHRAVRWRDADVAEVPGAVPRRNIQAAAEGDRQVRVVAAHARPLIEGLPRRLRRPRVLIAENDVAMHVVADGVDAIGAGGRMAEEV